MDLSRLIFTAVVADTSEMLADVGRNDPYGWLESMESIDLAEWIGRGAPLWWEHGRDRRGEEPIGVCIDLDRTTLEGRDSLVGRFQLADEPFALYVACGIAMGSIRGVSAGLTMKRAGPADGRGLRVLEKAVLREISACFEPRNRNALITGFNWDLEGVAAEYFRRTEASSAAPAA